MIGQGARGSIRPGPFKRRDRSAIDAIERLQQRAGQFVYLETLGGGAGARFDRDGMDGIHVHMTNTSNLPVEALELEYPLTLLRYELVDGGRRLRATEQGRSPMGNHDAVWIYDRR